MPLQAGIVGLPNVGKSTLFQALTSSKAEAANYPFCTIEPNVGIVPVPDLRLSTINSLETWAHSSLMSLLFPGRHLTQKTIPRMDGLRSTSFGDVDDFIHAEVTLCGWWL